MSRKARLTIIMICVSVCSAGMFVVPMVDKERDAQKTHVTPVKNRAMPERIYIRV